MKQTLEKQRNAVSGQGASKGTSATSADLKNILTGVQSQELFQNIVQVEVDKRKKKAKEDLKENEDKLGKKNKIINDLLTESETNKATAKDLNNVVAQKKNSEAKLQSELEAVKLQLASECAESKQV